MVTGALDAQLIARIGLKEADGQRDTRSSFFQDEHETYGIFA